MINVAEDTCKVQSLTEKKKFRLLGKIIDEYDCRETNLIQILHMAQSIFGHLPPEVRFFIAENMNIPKSKVDSVLTFYSYFSTKPKWEYTVSICLGTACYVRGGKEVLQKIKEVLQIDVGEATNDKKFSLQVTRCIGACGLAPVVMINDEVHKQVNPDQVPGILGELK